MSGWTERETESRKEKEVSPQKAAELDAARDKDLPVIQKEAAGAKLFDQIKFQPVRAYGYFDAEFAVKDGNIIFHFWPHGFHEAQQVGKRIPDFPVAFESKLNQAMSHAFTRNRVEVREDRDMGAYFVKATGYGSSISPFEMAVGACQRLYRSLSGET
jgi:hypothetical protein